MKPNNSVPRYAVSPRLVLPIGDIDPWLYTGLFTNPSYLIHHFGGTYYFSRLPWTLPGLIVFHFATPVVASILLNACLVATSSLSLYFTIRWHYGTVPALLASVSMAVNPWYFSSVAWDYPDGPAIAYGFLAAAFALRPHGSRALNTVLMASCLALSGFTNMSGGPMVLSILIFPLWRWRRSLVELVRECVYIAIGLAGTTLAIAPVSRVVLGYWLFFMPQINLARYELGTPGVLTRMWGSGTGFLLTAYHLFPVAFLLVFGFVVFVTARVRGTAAWPAYLALFTCTLIYSIQEFALHGVVLHVAYASVYMLVPLFVLAGVIFGELWRGAEGRRGWIAAGTLIGFGLALPWAVYLCRESLFADGLWSRMFLTAAVAVLLLAGWRSAPHAFRAVVVLLLLPLLFVGPARESTLSIHRSSANRDDFDALMRFNEVLKASVPREQRVVFWSDRGERDQNLFISAQSLWIFGGFDFDNAFHAASPDEIRNQLSAHTTLVHLTNHPEKIAGRLKLMDSRGVRYDNERQWTVRSGPSLFYVAAQDVTDISALH